MLYKAEDYDTAELELFRMLADQTLPDFARKELKELLEVVLDEKALKESRDARYTNHEIDVALRGGVVGYGTMPFEDFVKTSGKVERLLWRFAETVGGFEFRTRGRPADAVRALVEARVSPAMAGSYRFRVRLVEPRQLEMFETENRIEVRAVADTLFGFVENLAEGNDAQLHRLVPDEAHRNALTRLVRALVPTGERVAELEIRRPSKRGPDETLLLTPDLRKRIRPPKRSQAPEEAEPETEIRGVLRALDLDAGVLEVRTETHGRVQLTSTEKIFDEWVGPFVDKEVQAIGRWRGTKFEFDDIELVEES